MSDGGPFYTFNGHREALYRLLEATVRGEPGCPDAARDISRPRDGHEAEVEQASSAYPSPLLWFDEMRPSDIDAYHAANGRGRRSGSDNNASLEEDPPTVGSIPPPTTMDPGGECSRSHVVSTGGSSGAGEGGMYDREGRRLAVASSVRRPAGEALAERQAIVPGSTGSTSTPDRRKCAAIDTQQPPPLPPPSAKGRNHLPHVKASGVPEEEREEDRAAAARMGSSSARDMRYSKPLEKNDCHPMMTPAVAAAATTTPPDPSQATQMMFLPGLPSQVLVTQQQGDAEWEHPEEDESPQREQGTAASEDASPCSTHPRPPAGEDHALAEPSVASAGGKEPSDSRAQIARPEPDSSKSCSSNNVLVPGGEEREEASSRQNDGFTLALSEFVGEAGPAQGTLPNGSGGGSSGGGGDERLRPPLKYVPTFEVLPSGWSGGQAGVVAFLEKHLSHACARFPGGYAVRALQLACHVLRQPTVCVWTRETRGGSVAPEGAATVADGDHHEVVGIAGFVWEILRANGGDGKELQY